MPDAFMTTNEHTTIVYCKTRFIYHGFGGESCFGAAYVFLSFTLCLSFSCAWSCERHFVSPCKRREELIVSVCVVANETDDEVLFGLTDTQNNW